MHKIIHFWNPYNERNTLLLISKGAEHVSLFTHVELSWLMSIILEIPSQYVAYQNNVAYALITLYTKSHTLNK